MESLTRLMEMQTLTRKRHLFADCTRRLLREISTTATTAAEQGQLSITPETIPATQLLESVAESCREASKSMPIVWTAAAPTS
jgi:hypothetical protein